MNHPGHPHTATRLGHHAGHAPGELVHIGETKTAEPRLLLIEFDPAHYQETPFAHLGDDQAHQPDTGTLWLNVYGLQDVAMMAEIGQRFGLHPLVLEDILNTHQRPKIEDYGDYIFIVTHVFEYHPASRTLNEDQISMVLGHGFVLTFQERPAGRFQPLRERLKNAVGPARRLGASYLAYSLLDVIVDHYFVTLDQLGDTVDELDSRLLAGQTNTGTLARIHTLKMTLLALRRALWPLREAVMTLQHGDSGLLDPETRLYLRDVYDHLVHLLETVDLQRDLVAGMVDLYVSTQSNRLNRQMRFLTVIATLFMPLTFISSIYGMNFDYMPELHWKWGYFAVLGLMAAIGGGMGYLFWRRRWW